MELAVYVDRRIGNWIELLPLANRLLMKHAIIWKRSFVERGGYGVRFYWTLCLGQIYKLRWQVKGTLEQGSEESGGGVPGTAKDEDGVPGSAEDGDGGGCEICRFCTEES